MATNYEYITSGTRAEEICSKLMNSPVVGLDTETTGTDPHKDRVTLLSLSSRAGGTFVVDTRDSNLLKAFKPLFENDLTTKVAHNGSFDYQMVKGSVGADTENIRCTMLGEKCLTAGLQFDGYSLEAVTKKYLGISRDKSLQKSFIGHTGEFSEAQRQYAADDTAYLLDIAEKMQHEAKSKGVLKTWRIESEALQSFADIEFFGQRVDAQKWKAVMKENADSAKQAKKDLDYYFAPVCASRFNFDAEPGEDQFEVDINYDSQPMVLQALRQIGLEIDGALIENTNKKTQKKIKDHPAIKALTKYRVAAKGLSGFGEQYLKAIHPVTGRVHFHMNQYGTETGRPACKDGLNCLNIPREKRYRDCFTTEDGRLISTVDYSGAELRIMADLSGDPLMVRGFNSGIDFHCFVAALLFNRERVDKKDPIRTPTKTLNFGLAYGMGPWSLYEQLNAAGYAISYDDCKRLYYKYMDTFVTTIQWLKREQKLASSAFVMRNLNGRTRHWFRPDRDKARALVEADLGKTIVNYGDRQIEDLTSKKIKGWLAAIEREGANFKIQSVNADFTKVAMHRCRKHFKKMQWDVRTYNSVYDEIVYDMHSSCATEAHEAQKRIMIEAANEMLTQVPMEVEGHLAPHWLK